MLAIRADCRLAALRLACLGSRLRRQVEKWSRRSTAEWGEGEGGCSHTSTEGGSERREGCAGNGETACRHQTLNQEKVPSLSPDSTKLDYPPQASLSAAHDFFTITSDVNARHSDRIPSTLTFDDDSTFTAEEAVMICKIAGDLAQKSSSISHQYTRTIDNIIQQMQKGRFAKKPAEDDRATEPRCPLDASQ
ncbi:uncharacterized protein EV420DRAFT_1479811 [Desarmillaria tabescens]|uniref:Uncharacterized protein n=1 Tax=Armillaria tabescens TaxID=1929756 RepID=A0AA39KET1_ARMTA|nr:uncharacterized protein EV420DRAFT_1479811 [Desarmillaria tabescens]KAK0458576.1 hypothetical protein EV420DRAFT_1479811 [Desarmillaria tabescens]